MALEMIYLALAVVNVVLATLVLRHLRGITSGISWLAYVFVALFVLIGLVDLFVALLGIGSMLVAVLDVLVLAVMGVLIYKARAVAAAFVAMSGQQDAMRQDKEQVMRDKHGEMF